MIPDLAPAVGKIKMATKENTFHALIKYIIITQANVRAHLIFYL